MGLEFPIHPVLQFPVLQLFLFFLSTPLRTTLPHQLRGLQTILLLPLQKLNPITLGCECDPLESKERRRRALWASISLGSELLKATALSEIKPGASGTYAVATAGFNGSRVVLTNTATGASWEVVQQDDDSSTVLVAIPSSP